MDCHSEDLRAEGEQAGVVEAIKLDYHHAQLSEADRVMLRYAERLTMEPGQAQEDDVIALREAGFADEDISDIAQIVAYFNYINRVCDGLGVKQELV